MSIKLYETAIKIDFGLRLYETTVKIDFGLRVNQSRVIVSFVEVPKCVRDF